MNGLFFSQISEKALSGHWWSNGEILWDIAPLEQILSSASSRKATTIYDFPDIQPNPSIVALKTMRASLSSVSCIHRCTQTAEQWPLRPYPIPLVEL
jgi:hypothetical protein